MLSLLALIYGKIADTRNRLYDRGFFETFDLGARTVSIGNITAGGTGKTPLVAYVAEILATRGETVCILTRGYGRKSSKKRVLVSNGSEVLANVQHAGDEPLELAGKLIGKAVVLADANRVAAAKWAQDEFGITTFILDDGFQHRKVKRDVDVVCIDATDPFGAGRMLPAGRLREPLHNIKRANVIVITRANLVDNIENLKSEIFTLNASATIFVARNQIVRFSGLEEFLATTQGPQNVEILDWAFAFCGIGNPENFFDQLRQENVDVAATYVFRDHHFYSQSDVATIEKLAGESNAQILLTTAKDAVKLSNLRFKIPCFVVEVEMLIDDAEAFAAMV
jgi:tetraacyldisaccharide 4'-kinase